MEHFYTKLSIVVVTLCLCHLLKAQSPCPITVSAGPDKYLCSPPSPTQLQGEIDGTYLNFIWTPTAGLTGANTLTPTVNTATTRTYVLTGRAVNLDNNLIVNGDFSGGNGGFTSDYTYSPGDLVPEGLYDITSNPQSSHPGFAPCPDHTGGGDMMVVNGAGTPNQNVWCQTIAVDPNAQYVFSCWVTTVVAASPARLQFEINGTTIGPIFNAPSTVCNWQNFYTTWNSGANTSATICILNQNTTLGGNDFALDDLVFAPICEKTDSVTVHVINVVAQASPLLVTIPCEGFNVKLNGTGSSTGPEISYLWETSNGNIVSGETTLNPTVNQAGMYTLTVKWEKDGVECTKTATVNVTLGPPMTAFINPPLPLGCGNSSINLTGNTNQPGAAVWKWVTLDGNIIGPDSVRTIKVDKPGIYELLVTNKITGCTAMTEVTVSAATNPPASNASVADTITCEQDSVILSGLGSSTGNNITYSWTTIGGAIRSGQNSLNAVAEQGGLYILKVTNTTNNCTTSDTVNVTAITNPPPLSTLPAETLDCNTLSQVLQANSTLGTIDFNWTTVGGNIVSGGNTANPLIDKAGFYIVRATNSLNGCSSKDTILVNENFVKPLAAAAVADSITCQKTSLNLNGSGSSTGANFLYQWTATQGGNIVSGSTTLSPLVNAAGLYTLVVTDTVNACTSIASVTVKADKNVVKAVANVNDSLSCRTKAIPLTAVGSTNTQSIAYLWTTTTGGLVGDPTKPTITANQPGVYQLLVTDKATGCTATDIAEVILDDQKPNINIIKPDTLTCRFPTTFITINNNQAGRFSYLWTPDASGNILNGATTSSPEVNKPGFYKVVVTNEINGCTSDFSVFVPLNNLVSLPSAAAQGQITCATPKLNLSTTLNPPNPAITYAWAAGSGGNILSGTNTPNPSIDKGGIYLVTVTNPANGCTASTNVVVLENKIPPPAEAGSGALLTCFDPVYTLTANNNVGSGFLFEWSSPNGHFTGPVNGIQADCDSTGLYFVKVTNPANGCASIDSILVAVNQQLPSLAISAPPLLTCLQKSVNITANASGQSLSYQWETLDGNIISATDGTVIKADEPGKYSVTVTDGINGCQRAGVSSVSQNIDPPKTNISAVAAITCANPTRDILAQNSAVGSFLYAWSVQNGGQISGPTDALKITATKAGSFILLSTNTLNGCTDADTIQLVEDLLTPIAVAGIDDTLNCIKNTITLKGTASNGTGLAPNWAAENGGNILSGGNSLAPIIDKPGTYILTVKNPANGCLDIDTVLIFNDLKKPDVAIQKPDTLSCTRVETALNGSGSTGLNFTPQWSTSGTGSLVGNTNAYAALANKPGTYTLLIQDTRNGCTSTASVAVIQNITPPTLDAGADGKLTCKNQFLDLNAKASGGPLKYQWAAQNGGNIVSGISTATPRIDKPGSYALTVTRDDNGCTANDALLVTQDTVTPRIQIAPPLLLTCTRKSVALTASLLQPSPIAFDPSWSSTNGTISSGQKQLEASATKTGLYTLVVLNTDNGCSSTAQITVNEDVKKPDAVPGPTGDITCKQSVLQLNGTGSSTGTNMKYDWTAANGGNITNGKTTLLPTVDKGGIYTLWVTNTDNGCTATNSVVIGEKTTKPPVLIAPPNVLNCIAKTVNLDASASAAPTYTALWATSDGNIVSGQNTFVAVCDRPGNYRITVTNPETGCSDTGQTLVKQDIAPPNAKAGPAQILHCNQPEVSLQGSSSTIGNMAYSWSTNNGNIKSGSTTAQPLVDAPGLYVLTLTNPTNGCTNVAQTNVSEVLSPSFVPTFVQPDCITNAGSVDFGPVQGGAEPFVYSVDNGKTYQNGSQFPKLKAGAYTLIVKDLYGCTDTESITLNEPQKPKVTLPPYYTIDLGESVLLEPELVIPNFLIKSWKWSPKDSLSCTDCPTPTANPQRTYVYTLVVTDKNSCTATAATQVRVNRARQVYAPNIFSPNGDGKNDFFNLFGKGVRSVKEMRVFDRWGDQLYFVENLPINDENAGWDGTYRGQLMNPGVYVWQAKIEFVDGQTETYFGDVTVTR